MAFNQPHNVCAMCKQKVNKSTKMRNKKLLCDWKRNFFCLVECFLKETQKLNMSKWLFLVVRLSTPSQATPHHIESLSDTVLTLWPEHWKNTNRRLLLGLLAAFSWNAARFFFVGLFCLPFFETFIFVCLIVFLVSVNEERIPVRNARCMTNKNGRSVEKHFKPGEVKVSKSQSLSGCL